MKVLWNDKIVERETVFIDIEDRGYQYGDGIYEVIRIYNSKMYMSDEHFDRLVRSGEKIKLELPYSIDILAENLNKLIEIEEIINGEVYLQVTRGVFSPRNHIFPEKGTVKSVLTANVLSFERPLAMQKNGIQAGLVTDKRWLHCDIKSLSLLGNLLSLNEAREKGFDDALLHREGYFTEASASNLWFVINNTLYTHPDGPLVLPGITKHKLLELAKEKQLAVIEQAVAITELPKITECFISNSLWEIVPVVSIDGQPVADGKRGELTKLLQDAYIEAIE